MLGGQTYADDTVAATCYNFDTRLKCYLFYTNTHTLKPKVPPKQLCNDSVPHNSPVEVIKCELIGTRKQTHH